MPTARNAKGSDLFCANDDESIIFGVQSKALSKRAPVPLGGNLDNLRSEWWIITVQAKNDEPTCYIMRLEEVKALAHSSDIAKMKSGKPAHWLQPRSYESDEFRNAWHRLEE